MSLMRSFVAVVDHGGFTNAGRALGIPKQAVSRHVQELEAHLKTDLLVRTTRRTALTHAGQLLYERAPRLLQQVDEAVNIVRSGHAEVSSSIVVAAPHLFGRRFLMPQITSFLRQHESVRIHLRLLESQEPLAWQESDILIHIGRAPDISAKRTKLMAATNHCFASPGYLRKHGEPEQPESLDQHATIHYSRMTRPTPWRLTSGRRTKEIHLQPRLHCNDAEAALDAAVAGLGITQLPAFMCTQHVERKRLRLVLPDWSIDIGDISLIYKPSPGLDPKIKAFRDQLVAHFRK